MILYPAIDLKDGCAVRLRRGAMDSATVFNADPAAQAAAFAEAGFDWLHVVDLDGAVAGGAVNRAAVRAILEAVNIPLQLGGGIRDLAAVESWLDAGVARVILGTAAVKTPEMVAGACRRFPGQVAVGIDARDGRVAVEGWAEASEMTAVEVARRFEDDGAAAIIYTDIERDGMLAGINLSATLALADAVATPIIASGGIASLDDIAGLLAVAERGIAGAICGRALYDGSIEPKSAVELVKGKRAAAC